MDRVQKKINITTSPTTSESLGISGSANLTAESSGFVGDDKNSLFTTLKENKSWSSTTSSNIHEEIDTSAGAENRK